VTHVVALAVPPLAWLRIDSTEAGADPTTVHYLATAFHHYAAAEYTPISAAATPAGFG